MFGSYKPLKKTIIKSSSKKKFFTQKYIKNKITSIIFLLVIFTVIFSILLLNIIHKSKIINLLKAENEILKSGLNIKLKEPIKEEYKDTFKTVTGYINILLSEYFKIQSSIKNTNYNFDINFQIKNFINNLNNTFLKNQNFPKKNYNKYSTLKNDYYQKIENVFNKYINDTEECDEYKNNIKQYILNFYSSMFNKEYSNIDSIIFDKKMNLGNALFSINNYIYICEILNCKNFYLSQNYYPFINNSIYNSEFGISVNPYNEENKNLSENNNSTILYISNELHFDKIIDIFRANKFFFPIRNYIFKEEFLSYMKLIETKEDDLYINIRSGEDVFRNKGYSPGSYSQPPLCFYRTIIDNFNFNNIYIISNGKENPVVEELLKFYKNIQYFHGTIEEDAAMILSAKNLVLSVSSFPVELIKLSDNLKNLFEYDLIIDEDKRFWHFTDKHLRPLKFNRFIMKPTKEYLDVMVPWGQKKEQFDKMINEKCDKKFKIIPSDFI